MKANRDRKLEARGFRGEIREALVGAAYDCQSRFWNIAADPDRVYAEANTLWLVAQYFCWIEILRRDTA